MTICLDNIKMHVIKTAENGVVSAEYAGGKIHLGYLVGKLVHKNQLTFTYCQIQTDGTLDNGISVCELSKNEHGKITLTETSNGNRARVNLERTFSKKFRKRSAGTRILSG